MTDPYRSPARTVADVLGLFANVSVEIMVREIARRLEEDPSPEMVKAAAETLRQNADLLEKQRKLIETQKHWIEELKLTPAQRLDRMRKKGRRRR